MITPYKRRPKHRAVGLIANTDGGEVVADFEDSVRIANPFTTDRIENVPPNVSLYIDAALARSYLRQGIGEAIFQNHSMTRYLIDGRAVYPIPAEVSIDLASLAEWRDWVESCGAGITSRTGTALSLFRASLSRPYLLARGELPPLGNIVGGRVHGTGFNAYPKIEIWDISAAYARTLANLRCDGVWRESPFDLDSVCPQFADVLIHIPRMRWGPLPKRSAWDHTRGLWLEVLGRQEFPTGNRYRGIWSSDELRSAVNAGCTIAKVHRSWRLFAHSRQPFAPWWTIIERGRKLPAKAGELAKITGNVLWGVFAGTSGTRERVRYGKGRTVIREPVEDSPASAFHRDYALAELITSHIRSRVYDELMLPAGEHLIGVNVDGGLVEPNGFRPAADDWRLKDRGSECAFFKPYIYAYRRENGQVVYKWAGVPERQQREAFQSWKRHYFGSSDPQTFSDTRRAVYRLKEAFEGSCIDKPESDEVARYFGSLANA